MREQRGSLGTVRQWHWISSAVCLVGMVLFAITGITLNHADIIPADPRITTLEAELPAEIAAVLKAQEVAGPLPEPVLEWLAADLDLHVGVDRLGEWSEEEVYLALPEPGGDAWLSLDLAAGELFYERTDRGWISYFNDLHKARSTGMIWRWFIDVFAIACIVFCVTGLLLLIRHADHRPTTWPTVGLGLVVPLVLIILFVH